MNKIKAAFSDVLGVAKRHPIVFAVAVIALSLVAVPFVLPLINKGLGKVKPGLELKPLAPKA